MLFKSISKTSILSLAIACAVPAMASSCAGNSGSKENQNESSEQAPQKKGAKWEVLNSELLAVVR